MVVTVTICHKTENHGPGCGPFPRVPMKGKCYDKQLLIRELKCANNHILLAVGTFCKLDNGTCFSFEKHKSLDLSTELMR